MRVWVDASTLIALDRIGEVALVRRLLRKVAVTEEVAKEVFTGKESPTLRAARGRWIQVVRVRGDRAQWMALGLGPGEASLLLTPSRDTLVLDERDARLVARGEGRAVVGLVGLLVRAALNGKLKREEVRTLLRKLAESGFHLSGALLRSAEEALGGPPSPPS